MEATDGKVKTVIEGIHYATDERILVTLEAGKISEMHSIPKQEEVSLPYIAPGLVDLQINGHGGDDFNTLPISEKLVEQITSSLWKEGITTYTPTIITNSDNAIQRAVEVIAKASKDNQHVNDCLAGIHLEGPFISPEDGPRGAHGKEYIKPPNWQLFQTWQKAANGMIKMITISPEWPSSIEFIAKCVENDVIVSIGHTAATIEQIQKAVRAGAKLSTHLGNGAHVMLPRHPNYIWEQLAQDDLWTCIIADGFHLPDSFLKVVLRTKGVQSLLVSDAVYLSGLEPGEYETHIGGKVVLTSEGKLYLQENPNLLAGSVKMLKDGITHLTRAKLCTLKEAWEMASIRPATFMKLPTQAGLVKGTPADLVVFKWEEKQVKILQTYKAGTLVYSA
ncbi:N-acetylglucosamine-6-phosphate deacetylase [Lederbergia galactosidilytica]|uniref:N-acetylglucosamine-6-phosphate deacetylase n=1 Tax=Lederbergia galactosidilytica TaxID=217031 RepID=A0A177ZJA8_9BACI|nr:N-acetylglucosamine-6-phosphate deacetylase [Lederbergia galactosidilytica]OAK67885.1 N-acetylglucosamine-6-phosphate deacetylase [Lederbergia galactosidilytica]